MALQENKQRKTPEEIKKARALKIKEHAKAMLPSLLNAGYQNIVPALRSASNEDQVIIKRGLCSAASSLSILAAAEFEEAWSKEKGKFLADE
jgi:hypothetical protein